MNYKCKRDFFSKDNQYFEKGQIIDDEKYESLMFDDQSYFDPESTDEKIVTTLSNGSSGKK